MLNLPKFNSIDEIQHWVLSSLLENGEETSPRGMKTLELFPISFKLVNPRSRCVLNSARKWSFPLAIGEFCWHVSGSDDLSFIEYYIPRWREFSDDSEKVRGSCYGYRIFNSQGRKHSQWERLVKLLKSDLQSRRAILQFSEPELNLSVESKDVPCTSTIQFLVRNNKVHAIVYMRSNDAIWGLPYDIFLFTMLQELLACELNLELGEYTHIVGSLHIYERHYRLAQRIIENPTQEVYEMTVMTNHQELTHFLVAEEILRLQNKQPLPQITLSEYWRDLYKVLGWYKTQKIESSNKNVFMKKSIL